MKSAGRSALMAGAILSLVFCLATAVAAEQGDAARAAAEAFLRAGKYSEAIPLAQQVLAIREAKVGPGHIGVVYAINRLARAYEGQGRLRDAEPLYRRALAIRENVLGPNHPDVAESLAKLGRLYSLQGRNADAASV